MDTKWIPIGHEFRRIRAEFVETYGETRDASNSAEQAIFRRLKDGFLIARASHSEEDRGGGALSCERFILDDRLLSSAFWERLSNTSDWYRSIEWALGDFSFKSSTFDLSTGDCLSWLNVSVHQVMVCTPEADCGSENPQQSPMVDRGGRKPAPWWPMFTEELALYLQARGAPEGTGTQGQEEVYDAVCLLMRARGGKEPGRSTVLPVIGSVLKRIRTEI